MTNDNGAGQKAAPVNDRNYPNDLNDHNHHNDPNNLNDHNHIDEPLRIKE